MLKINVFPLAESPGRIVSRTQNLMKLSMSRVFASHGFNITPEHWAILSILWEAEGLNQAELARRVFKDRPNITRILDVLERNGFIRRVPDPNDRRSYNIHLTGEGKGVQGKLTPLVIKFLQKAFSGITQKELDGFMRMNEHIAKNLSSSLEG